MARRVALPTVEAQDVRRRPYLKTAELALVLFSAGALALIVSRWHLVREPFPAIWLLSFTLFGPFVLRSLQARWPTSAPMRFVADFFVGGGYFAVYFSLNAVIDAAGQGIRDDALLAVEQVLFGMTPALRLDGHTPGWLADATLLAYASHFFWPLLLGLRLWLRAPEAVFDRFVAAMTIFAMLNYVGYALVPVMGPRYFLVAHFTQPLEGIAGAIDVAFRGSPLARDCFPSGHTGVQLVMLSFAWRWWRPFFFAVAPVIALLLAGTIVGRFHYATDLLAAVPLWLGSMALAARWGDQRWSTRSMSRQSFARASGGR